MLYCFNCGAYVRHWTDKETGATHFLCIGCGKEGDKGEEVKGDEINQGYFDPVGGI